MSLVILWIVFIMLVHCVATANAVTLDDGASNNCPPRP